MTGHGRMTRRDVDSADIQAIAEDRLRLADRRELSAAARRRRAARRGPGSAGSGLLLWRISRLTEFPRKSPKRHRSPSPPRD